MKIKADKQTDEAENCLNEILQEGTTNTNNFKVGF